MDTSIGDKVTLAELKKDIVSLTRDVQRLARTLEQMQSNMHRRPEENDRAIRDMQLVQARLEGRLMAQERELLETKGELETVRKQARTIDGVIAAAVTIITGVAAIVAFFM